MMHPLRLIAILAGILILGYAMYTWTQSEKVPATIDLGSATNFKSIPATICKVGNDAQTITGNLYVFHDSARFEITSITTGKPIVTHIIVTPADVSFVWLEGEKTGYNFDYNSLYRSLNLELLTHVDCSSWWIPAGDLFVVPQDVVFPKK